MELLEVQKEADGASRKAIGFGALALLLAAAFGWLVAHIGSGGPESQGVVVAKEAIDALTPLKAEQLKVVDWPIAAVPEGVLANIQDVVAQKNDEGRRIYLSALVPNEPVFKSKLSDPSRGLGVSQLVEPNMRAFVVQVDDAAGRAQIVHPGSMVDVIASVTDNRTRAMSSRTILQNIKVLAIGDRVDIPRQPADSDHAFDHSQAEGRRVVTLLVTLNDAEVLALAVGAGRLDLALRSDADTQPVNTPGADLGRLLPGRDAAPTAAAAPPPAEIPSPHPARRPPRSHMPASSAPAPAGPTIYKVRR